MGGMNFEWAHAIAAIIGSVIGAVTAIFGFGWRMGQREGRMTDRFENSIRDAERRIEQKFEEWAFASDETLKGLRQKINDVELDSERRFLLKGDFNDFREEYRDDMRDLKAMISRGA